MQKNSDGNCVASGNKYMCPCYDEANKATTMGICTENFHCEGKSSEGLDGKQGEVGGLDKLLESTLGKLMEKLMGGKGGGGGGEQPPGGAQGSLYPPCVYNAATKTVKPIPCTENNGAINYGDSNVNDPLGGELDGNISDDILGGVDIDDPGTTIDVPGDDVASTTTDEAGNKNSDEGNNDGSSATTTGTEKGGTTQVSVLAGQQQVLAPANKNGQSVLQGDISGGTLFVRSRDPQSNTEVAGFYGGSTFGTQGSTSMIGSLCASRPWAQGILGGVLPASFFDGVCQRFGYQVGSAVPTIVPTPNSPSIPVGGTRQPTITITQTPSQGTTIEPEVDIWANPPSVRLGSRTYIFWTSKGVESCTQSGPNFSHNTLSGGASTVPLSDASTFTMECTTSDGKVIEDTVRVNLSI
jgi:hypothetical protein